MKKLTILACTSLAVASLAGCTTPQNTHTAMNNTTNTTTQTLAASKQPLTDTTITAAVKDKFINENLFASKDVSAMTIHVETINGVVHLTGTAKNHKEALNAVKLAKTVDGVKGVTSKITIVKAS